MLGAISRIALNLVEIDDTDTTQVVFHHFEHLANQHCAGCKHVKHPGCGGIGLCNGCLDQNSPPGVLIGGKLNRG
jgi:hypothetical protein